MGNNDATNVSTAKPKVSGAVHRAPLGTPLPTDATSPLDPAFINLGYVSEDGASNANEMDVSTIKAWGGAIVYRSLTELTDNFKTVLIESKNVDVLKTVYGNDNVSVNAAGDIHVEVKAEDPIESSYVIDTVLRGGKAQRIVIADGAITARDEIVYNDSDPIGYGITISAYPDGNGKSHDIYIEGNTISG